MKRLLLVESTQSSLRRIPSLLTATVSIAIALFCSDSFASNKLSRGKIATGNNVLRWMTSIPSQIQEGREFPFVVNLGIRPTFGDFQVEVVAEIETSSGAVQIPLRQIGTMFSGITPPLEEGLNEITVTANLVNAESCKRKVSSSCTTILSTLSAELTGALPLDGIGAPGPGDVDPNGADNDPRTNGGIGEETDGTLDVVGADPSFGFTSTTDGILIAISDAEFYPAYRSTRIVLNGETLDPSRYDLASETLLEIEGPWLEGENDIYMIALDSEGKRIEGSMKFWAGSRDLTINVVDPRGVSDYYWVELYLKGGELDRKFAVETVSDQLFIENLSAFEGRVVIRPVGVHGLAGYLDITDSQTTATVTIDQYTYPGGRDSVVSPDGLLRSVQSWKLGSESQGLGVTFLRSNENPYCWTFFQNDTCGVSKNMEPVAGVRDEKVPPPGTAGQNIFFISGADAGTATEVRESVHEFRAVSNSVTIHYRFTYGILTSNPDIPWVLQPNSDSYSVTLKSGAVESTDATAYPGGNQWGHSAWRSRTIATVPGEVVKIIMKTTRAGGTGEHRFGPGIVLRPFGQTSVNVERFRAYHVAPIQDWNEHGNALQRLSVDRRGDPTKVRFKGKIRIEASPYDDITDVRVKVYQGLNLVGTAKVLTLSDLPPIGLNGLTEGVLLFEMPVDTNYTSYGTIKEYALRVEVQTKDQGARIFTSDHRGQIFGLMFLGKHLHSGNRFGDRDREWGEDSWIDPRVFDTIRHLLSNVTIPSSGGNKFRFQLNDASKLNGGLWSPHQTHQLGLDFDVANLHQFNLSDPVVSGGPGHPDNVVRAQRRLKSAKTLRAILNDPTIGSKIDFFYVSRTGYVNPANPVDECSVQVDPFWVELCASPSIIGKVTAQDGHANYYHVRLKP